MSQPPASSPSPWSPQGDSICPAELTLPDEFGERLALLSRQELAVLDLATEGKTDAQIAHAMGLSVSTVNSYWVRIRGKLGQFGRTEIATGFLRHQARVEQASLRRENQRLQARFVRAQEEYETWEATHADTSDATWPMLALFHAPGATIVATLSGLVMFANRQAMRLFGAEGAELEGLTLQDLTAPETPEPARARILGLMGEDGPDRWTVGVAEPFFAQRRDGTGFRAILHATCFQAAAGSLVVFTVEDFLSDAEAVLQALRQPLTS